MNSSTVKAVIAMPLYNNEQHVEEAIESLLGQDYSSFALVLVDDCSTDRTGEIAERYDRKFAHVTYHRNPRRLGMIDNWRRGFDLARELYPGAQFFAWGSDHDVWHPHWLSALVRELESDLGLALAYPQNIRISETGDLIKPAWSFDTDQVGDTLERLVYAYKGMRSGDMVYGLFRADLLEKVGVFRRTLLPDRLLLSEMALYGRFRQVPHILWFRRFAGLAKLSRQRAAFFPEKIPAYAYIPWWLTHSFLLFWNLVVKRSGSPKISGKLSYRVVITYALTSYRVELNRKFARTVAKIYRKWPILQSWRHGVLMLKRAFVLVKQR